MVYSFPVNTFKYNALIFSWKGLTFVVQGFIMLSACKFFLTKKDEVPYFKYIKIRLKSVAIPYVFAFIVYYIVFMLRYDYKLDFWFIFKNFITGNLVYHLYFIPLILQFDLLTPLWKKIIDKVCPVAAIPLFIVLTMLCQDYLPYIINKCFPDFTFLYNDRIVTTYLSFYIIGGYIGKNYDKFLNLLVKHKTKVFIIYLFITLVFSYFTYVNYNYIYTVSFYNNIHSLYVISALIILFLIAFKIAPFVMDKFKILKDIDKASFYIYLWHVLTLYGANYILEKFGIISDFLSFIIRIIIVYPVTIFLCILYFKKIKSK